MAHEIERNNCFFTGQKAWHGLGTVLTDAPTVQEAWKLAYPHEIFKLDSSAIVYDENGEPHYQPIKEVKHIVRDDGKYLGSVSPGYGLVQPYEAFKWYEPWIESGEITLEAGGSLREGTRMWTLGKVRGASAEVGKGDTVNGYLLAYTSFDGSLSHGVQFCTERVVCANTLAIAQSESSAKQGFKIRHTSTIHEKLEDIQQKVDLIRRDFNNTVDAYKTLEAKDVTADWCVQYANTLFLKQDDEGKNTTQSENKVLNVLGILTAQRERELVPARPGSAWEAYNAVTRYLTFGHGRTQDSRLNSLWFGESQNINKQALDLALTM